MVSGGSACSGAVKFIAPGRLDPRLALLFRAAEINAVPGRLLALDHGPYLAKRLDQEPALALVAHLASSTLPSISGGPFSAVGGNHVKVRAPALAGNRISMSCAWWKPRFCAALVF